MMHRSFVRPVLSTVSSLFNLAFVVLFAGTTMAASAQQAVQQAASKPAAVSPMTHLPLASAKAESEETAAPAKPGSEGLKVHGHWKLTAKNPDGTIANQVEFENTLLNGGVGDFALASLLSGYGSFGEWSIFVVGTTGFCATYCQFAPTMAPTDYWGSLCPQVPKGVCVAGMTTTLIPANSPSIPTSQIVLAGSFTATTAGNITSVNTQNYYCLAGVPGTLPPTASFAPTASPTSPASCKAFIANASSPINTFGGSFTGTLNPTFGFVSGQIVQVTVTLSFS